MSKGQANFETLDGTTNHIFFILKAKCWEVERELGVAMGDVVANFDRSAEGKAP
ncbi:MAG TPA: ARMT1-like domain-containing protein [Anaerolineae bacterium]|nr:ARMT1-like domain-containing protein [Anaerolineae bacterium]